MKSRLRSGQQLLLSCGQLTLVLSSGPQHLLFGLSCTPVPFSRVPRCTLVPTSRALRHRLVLPSWVRRGTAAPPSRVQRGTPAPPPRLSSDNSKFNLVEITFDISSPKSSERYSSSSLDSLERHSGSSPRPRVESARQDAYQWNPDEPDGGRLENNKKFR